MIVYCDKCEKEFEYESIKIKKCSVEIADDKLLLEYFTCPFCDAVYEVLLVEETKYRELVDDLKSVEQRIRRQKGKGNPVLIEKLQKMALLKKNRIKNYVSGVSSKYPGSFVLETENNQQEKNILYIYRENTRMKGEN